MPRPLFGIEHRWELKLVTGRPSDRPRLRRERGSVVVVLSNQCHEDFQLATSNTARDVNVANGRTALIFAENSPGRWIQELKDGLSCFK